MAKYAMYKNYFVRQAVMPLSETEKNPLISDSGLNSIDEICRNPIFRQAILCASESLYASMNDYISGKIYSAKRKRQIESSLCQYWIRMSTRATPFGLFSSVSMGNTELDNNSNAFYAVVDADCEWLFTLSKVVEEKYLEHLSFITNDLVSDNGIYFKLPYIPGADDNTPVMVEKNPITTYIVEQCKSAQKSYGDLIEEIQHIYPEIGNSHIRDNIKQLLGYDVILSSLRPNLHCSNLLGSFYEQLKKRNIANELSTQLEDCLAKIDYISNHIFAENTEQELFLLISNMRKLNNTARVLKIDLLKKPTQCVVNKENIADIEDFANFFVSALTHLKSKFTVYDEYKDLFLNEYGDYKMVQLSELIDQKTGIGLPHTFKEFHNKKRGQKVYKNEPSPQFLYYFIKKYRQAIQNSSAIVIDDMIDKIGTRENLGNAPVSFDLIFKIATDDEGKSVFICNKDFGCIGAGRTIGRFTANWKEAADIMKDLSLAEHTDKDCVICDLLYMPKRLHLGNVATGSKLYEYSLAFYQHTTQHHIPISDLYIMIENNKFQLVSKQLGKKIKVNTSNLLYYFGDSPEIRFIKEIQFDGVIRWECDILDRLLSFDYMPEIRYKSFILRPETWTIVPPIRFACFDNFDKWFVEEYGFLKNKRVSLLFADNELLIDINNQQCRYLIYKQYLHENRVTIVKYYSSDNVSYATEISLPFICEDKIFEHNVKCVNGIQNNKNQISFISNRTLQLGKEWVTLNLYGCPAPEKYISNQLKKTISKMISLGLIDGFFFLHYADPMYHIRVRFFKKNGSLDMDKITTCFNEHIKNGYVFSFEFTTYNREVERYGGQEGTRAAEGIFCIESQIVMQLPTTFTDEQRERFFVTFCLYYLKMWNWNDDQQLEWLNKHTNPQKYSSQWRKCRCKYNEFYYSSKETYLSKELQKKWEEAISFYRTIFSGGLDMQQRILSSLLHMFFNRNFGMNRDKEERLMTFARNLLCDILFRKNQIT